LQAGILPFFKIAELILVQGYNDSLETVLFRAEYLLFTLIIVGFLYPMIILFLIVGTFWYAEAYDSSVCLSEELKLYYMIWIIGFYCFAVGYTLYISYLAIYRYKNLELDIENGLLDIQYPEYQTIFFENTRDQPRGLRNNEIERFGIEYVDCKDDLICSICLEKFFMGQKVRITSCNHRFHPDCIDKWLTLKGNCPNCLCKFYN
jgi:Ring finger domain